MGRPPSITIESIAKAALDVGLSNANVRNVARELGVTAAGLYRHVSSQEDLVRVVVRYIFAQTFDDIPQAATFQDSLLAFGRCLFSIVSEHPDAIRRMYDPTGDPLIEIATFSDTALSLAMDDGYSEDVAYEIWMRVTAIVIGEAIMQAAQESASRRYAARTASVLQPRTRTENGSGIQVPALWKRSVLDHFEFARRSIAHLLGEYGFDENAGAPRPSV